MPDRPTLNKSQGKEYLLPCERCDNETFHNVLVSAETSWGDQDGGGDNEYQVVQCQGCHDISFRQDWTSSTEYEQDPETGEWNFSSHQELFPSRLAGRKLLKSQWHLPVKVREMYKEAHASLLGGSRILCGVGIRAVVEAVCRDLGSVGGNLETKIDGLVKNGQLTSDGADLLHRTRLLGNKAAHEQEPLSAEQLAAAMDVIEHLLLGVYLIKEKAKTLPPLKHKAAPVRGAKNNAFGFTCGAGQEAVIPSLGLPAESRNDVIFTALWRP